MKTNIKLMLCIGLCCISFSVQSANKGKVYFYDLNNKYIKAIGAKITLLKSKKIFYSNKEGEFQFENQPNEEDCFALIECEKCIPKICLLKNDKSNEIELDTELKSIQNNDETYNPAMIRIKGVISNQNNEPVTGAKITVIDTPVFAISNEQGEFECSVNIFKLIKRDRLYIHVSLEGYESKTKVIELGETTQEKIQHVNFELNTYFTLDEYKVLMDQNVKIIGNNSDILLNNKLLEDQIDSLSYIQVKDQNTFSIFRDSLNVLINNILPSTIRDLNQRISHESDSVANMFETKITEKFSNWNKSLNTEIDKLSLEFGWLIPIYNDTIAPVVLFSPGIKISKNLLFETNITFESLDSKPKSQIYPSLKYCVYNKDNVLINYSLGNTYDFKNKRLEFMSSFVLMLRIPKFPASMLGIKYDCFAFVNNDRFYDLGRFIGLSGKLAFN